MRILDFINEHMRDLYKKKFNAKRMNLNEKIASYLLHRLEDLETDFCNDADEYAEMVGSYENTELTPHIMENLRFFCGKYYNTMVSSDVDYLIDDQLSKEDLYELVTTNY